MWRDLKLAMRALRRTPGFTVIVLRSLKHPAEVVALRRIYGLRFVVISASAKREVIVKAMARRNAGKR